MDDLQVQLRRVAASFDAELPPRSVWRDRQVSGLERRGPFLVAAALLVALLAFIAGAAVLGGGAADPPEPRRAEQTVDGLRLVLEVEDAVLPADETLRGTLTFENVAGRPLTFGGIAGPADPTDAATIDVVPPAGLIALDLALWERLTGFGGDLRLRGDEVDSVSADAYGYVELAPGATRRFTFESDPTGPDGPLFIGSGLVRAEWERGSGEGVEVPITLTGLGGSLDRSSDTFTRSAAAAAVLAEAQLVEYLGEATAEDVLPLSLDAKPEGWVALVGNGSGSYAEIVLDRDTLETISFEIVRPRPPTTQQVPDDG